MALIAIEKDRTTKLYTIRQVNDAHTKDCKGQRPMFKGNIGNPGVFSNLKLVIDFVRTSRDRTTVSSLSDFLVNVIGIDCGYGSGTLNRILSEIRTFINTTMESSDYERLEPFMDSLSKKKSQYDSHTRGY